MRSTSISQTLSPSSDSEEHQVHQQSIYNHDELLHDQLIFPIPCPTTNAALRLKRSRSSEPPIKTKENNSPPPPPPPPPPPGVLDDQSIAAPNPRKGEPAQPRLRGRPKGSKNKPKLEPTIRNHVIEILPGSDVVEIVQNFSRTHNVGVSILNGLDQVKNVKIRKPTSQEPVIILPGTHDLISISGVHVETANMTNPPPEGPRGTGSYSYFSGAQTSYLAVNLASPTGVVCSGLVIGKLIAANNVLLNVSTFADYGFYGVATKETDPNQGRSISIGGGGSNMGRGSNSSPDPSPSSDLVFNVDDGLNWDHVKMRSPKRPHLGDFKENYDSQ